MIGQADNSIAKHICDRFEELKQLRTHAETHMKPVARLYRPHRRDFGVSTGSEAKDLNLHELFNSTTLQSATNATSSLYSTICNPANRWFKATTADLELAEWREVKVWLDIVTNRMLASFAPSVSNFYQSAVSWTADTSILGTGCMISDEAMGRGRRRLSDQCVSPADFVFGRNAEGEADDLIIERWLTPLQAARYYGDESLPPKVLERLAKGDSNKDRYLQAYQLNDEYQPHKLGRKGFQFLSTHVCETEKAVVRQKGTYEQSFAIPCWMDGGQTWGLGLGYQNLPSAVKLQIQERQNEQAGALAARPPIATTGARALKNAAKLSPGKFLHGALSARGDLMAKPVFTMNGLPITLDMQRQTIEEVEKGWHAAMLALQGRTGLNTLEVMERNQERLRLMAPYIGNMQTEGLAYVLDRRFKLLWRAGQIPPPPKDMERQPLNMAYTSVAAMAQKAEESAAITRILDDTIKLAAAQPDPDAALEVWDNVDLDYTQKALREAMGGPERMHRSPDEVEARRQTRAQQAQAQQAMAMAQQAAAAGKDMAQAEQMGMPVQ